MEQNWDTFKTQYAQNKIESESLAFNNERPLIDSLVELQDIKTFLILSRMFPEWYKRLETICDLSIEFWLNIDNIIWQQLWSLDKQYETYRAFVKKNSEGWADPLNLDDKTKNRVITAQKISLLLNQK